MNFNTDSIRRTKILKIQHEALGFAEAGFTAQKTWFSSQKANFSISCFKRGLLQRNQFRLSGNHFSAETQTVIFSTVPF